MERPASSTFASLLRGYRLAVGLTQEQLGERAGLSRRGIADLERGARQFPQHATVALLSDAFGLSPEQRAIFVASARRARRRPKRYLQRETSSPSPAPWALVSREQELAIVERLLAGERSLALMVAGEPGIGKTRLLHEATTRAQALGWAVLAGGCAQRSGQEAYEPLVGALGRHLTGRTPAQQRRELQGCAWLVRLLPELAESVVLPSSAGTLSAEQERRQLFAAVARYLRNIAGSTGTLLVLDDLQWAGSDALDLLNSLARAGGATALRVIGAYRSTEARPGSPLATLLADLARDGLVEQRVLAALSPEESVALLANVTQAVGSAWTEELTEQVVRRTGGVPFFLVSCAQSLHVASPNARMASSIPWNVAESILQRVAPLPSAAQALLRIASVIGREIPRTLLLGVAREIAMTEDTVLESLEALDRARLLVAPKGAGPYQFSHDLVHEVVEQDLAPARRAVLHRQVAAAIERLPERVRTEMIAELSWHLLEAHEGARALPYLLQAGDYAVTIYAFAQAERQYRMALELAREVEDLTCVAESHMRLAQLFLGQARYDDALAHVEEAAAIYSAHDDRGGLAWATAHTVLIHALSSTAEHETEPTLRVLESLDTPDAPQHVADAYSAIFYHYFTTGRYREAIPLLARRIVAAARTAKLDRALAQALGRAVAALLLTGSPADALRAAEETIPRCEAAGEELVLTQLVHLAAVMHTDAGDFRAGRRYIQHASALVEHASGDPSGPAFLGSIRARLAFFSGEWDEARHVAEQSVERGRTVGSSHGLVLRALISPLIELGRMRLVSGAIGPARDALDEAIAAVEHPFDLPVVPWSQGLRAECDVATGNAPAARDRLRRVIEPFALVEWGITMALPSLAEALVELGEWAEAEDVLNRGLACAQGKGERVTLVDLLRIQAVLRCRQRRWHEAVEAVEESLILSRAMPYPYAEAKALAVSGHLNTAKGELEHAREQYEAALAICVRLGEGLYRPRIERVLAGLNL